jgi:hypothetical protein
MWPPDAVFRNWGQIHGHVIQVWKLRSNLCDLTQSSEIEVNSCDHMTESSEIEINFTDHLMQSSEIEVKFTWPLDPIFRNWGQICSYLEKGA